MVSNVDESDMPEDSTDQEMLSGSRLPSESAHKFGKRHQSIDAVRAPVKGARKLLLDD